MADIPEALVEKAERRCSAEFSAGRSDELPTAETIRAVLAAVWPDLPAARPEGDAADDVWTAGFEEGRAHERRKIYCGCGLCCASTPPERRGEWHKQHCQPRLAGEVGGEGRG